MENKFLYLKLYETLKNEIENGVLAPGDRLPAEDELRARFHVSTITIKKSLSMLAEDGFVRRVPGRGTFVKGREPAAAAPVIHRAVGHKLIGLVLEHVASPFGLDMLYEIDRCLYERGYRLCVRYSYGDRDRETEEINFLRMLGVVGMLIMPCHGNFYNPTLLRMILDNFPIVLVDKKLDGIPVPSVRTDNIGAAKTLVRHLHARGARRIALLSLEVADTTSLKEREDGFNEQTAALGLPECTPCYVHVSQDLANSEPDAGIVAEIEAYLRAHGSEIDALVCTEYGLVCCLTRAAHAAGVALGRDGILVCCVDEDYLAPNGYTFTHVRQDEPAIARRAVEMLLTRIEQGDVQAEDEEVSAVFHNGLTT